MNTLRWVLLIPAAVVAWYAVFVIGLFTHGWVEQLICPPQDFMSGSCFNAGVQKWLDALMHCFVALAAVAVELAAVLVAPQRREAVLWVALALGLAAAAAMAALASAWTFFAAALIGGVAGAVLIVRVLRKRMAHAP